MDNLWKTQIIIVIGIKEKQITWEKEVCIFIKNESCPIKFQRGYW